MDVFCIRTQIFLIIICLPMLDFCANGEEHRHMDVFYACTQNSSTSLLRICVYAQIIQCWKTLLSKIIIRNFCACTQKSSSSLLRICVYAQIIQCWKTLLSEIIIRNFCAYMYAKIFHVSTKDLRICAKNPTNDYYKMLK